MSYRIKPKMILFDVGGTLFEGGTFRLIEGLSKLRLAANNPNVTDDEALADLWNEYTNEISGLKSKSGINLDMPLSAHIRYITMKTGLKFSISMAEQEEIFDRFNSARKVINGLSELLDKLNSLSIRTAVISNNAMSGESLALALKRWIPNERFEFCLTSADILYAKPYKDIFLTAARYAELDPTECWYCGDSFIPDVKGSYGVGMSPVLLDSKSDIPLEFRSDNSVDKYMVINSWHELSEYLNNLK